MYYIKLILEFIFLIITLIFLPITLLFMTIMLLLLLQFLYNKIINMGCNREINCPCDLCSNKN